MATIVHWGKYYPPDKGGIESVTCSLARGARRYGHAVRVVCFGQPTARSETDVGGVAVIRVPAAAKLSSQPLGWRYFRLLLREGRQADVVHLHAPNMLAAAASLLLRKGTRLVVHWHSDVVGKGLLGAILRPLETMMLRRADRVICTSPPYFAASRSLQEVAEKVVIIPLGVPDSQDDASKKSKASANCQDYVLPDFLKRRINGRRIILSIGRLVPYKGFEYLIDAAKILPDDAVVVIVGGGPLRKPLEARIAETGVGDKVFLAGHLEEAALRTLFAAAALYCMPSVERSEAFGVVLIEAMSWRLPIVATDIIGSGVPWVNRHGITGLNVPPGNAILLAEACSYILSRDDVRSRLSDAARKRFELEFAEDLTVQRTIQCYESLACT